MTPLERRPGFLIRRLHQLHIAIFAEECGGFGVTPAQISVLSALAANKLLDQQAIGRVVGIDRANTADILRRLESKALIARRIDVRDRRVRHCSITASGRALLRKMDDAIERAHTRTLAALPAAQRRQFVAQLQRLVDETLLHRDQ